jgi:hypothetical protein
LAKASGDSIVDNEANAMPVDLKEDACVMHSQILRFERSSFVE